MTTIDIKDAGGNAAGTAEVSSDVFGIEPNVHVMHQVVRAQRASWRQGTHNTRTRGMVSGGGRKPFRQKGTGRARQGSIRSPQWTHGGIALGPKPRSYNYSLTKKTKRLAMLSALSAKLAEGAFTVVKEFGFEKPSTKLAMAALKALGLDDRRVTLVIGDEDVNTFLSFRNIPSVNILPVSTANAYELIDNKALVFTEEALKYIEEVLA